MELFDFTDCHVMTSVQRDMAEPNLNEEFQALGTVCIDRPCHLLNCWLHAKTDNRTEDTLLMTRGRRNVSSYLFILNYPYRIYDLDIQDVTTVAE
jgi:hypothetical protein